MVMQALSLKWDRPSWSGGRCINPVESMAINGIAGSSPVRGANNKIIGEFLL